MRLRDFDINLLVVMEAVWMTRNVSAAAKMLNFAQSTISAALKRLRLSLDDDLFVWNGGEMLPTPMAEQVMPEVIAILDNARALLEQTGGHLSNVRRRMVIATADYVAGLIGAELLARAAREAPNLSFDFVSMKPQVVSRVTRPDVDLFIFPISALRVAGLLHELLYVDTYVCVGSRNNARLHDGMTAKEFLALRHVGYSALPRVALNHETMLWDGIGVAVEYKLTMENYLIFPRIVANSDAVAILPKRLALTLMDQWPLKWIVPPLPMPNLEISAVWKPGPRVDPALTWLRHTIAEISASFDQDAR